MKHRMVVTEVTQKESGWSIELKTVDAAGEKDYKGFAVLNVPDNHNFRVGNFVEVDVAIAVEEVAA